MLRAYDEGNLFGEPYGEGPVRVVWLHGWARQGHDFAACATELADAGIASVAFDLPGSGASPVPTVAGGARMYAELLGNALREVAESPVVLVGHSFGGKIATALAAAHPELVKTLIVTGAPLVRPTGHSQSRSPVAYRIIRRLHSLGLGREQWMEAARQRYGSRDYRNAHGVMRDVLVAAVNENMESELAQLRVPVAMVWGANDRDVPVAVAELASSMISSPHSLRVIASVGHLLPTEAPHELVESVLEALA